MSRSWKWVELLSRWMMFINREILLEYYKFSKFFCWGQSWGITSMLFENFCYPIFTDCSSINKKILILKRLIVTYQISKGQLTSALTKVFFDHFSSGLKFPNNRFYFFYWFNLIWDSLWELRVLKPLSNFCDKLWADN